MRALLKRLSAMPRLLAIDTSTEACSVALLDGERIVESYFEAPREHVQRLLPMIDALLAQHHIALRELDAIAFGRGPGAFTGLRICLGVVQGLAFGAALPVIPVSTLAALAQTAVLASASSAAIPVGSYICSAIDARMNEVYCGWFQLGDDGLVRAVDAERVCAPEAVPDVAVDAPRYGVGSGWQYAARMPLRELVSLDAALLPRAGAVARLALPLWNAGAVLTAEEAQPTYLRNDVAWAKA